MGTRCGDIDAAIVFYLMETRNWDAGRVYNLLNKESGLLGMADIGSSDLRDIHAASLQGNQKAATAIEACAYRIKKYIGAYAFAMGGLDAVVFTAGIGENAPFLRKRICESLEPLEIVLDEQRNAAAVGVCRPIHHPDSRVAIWVVPTDEERAIAIQTAALISRKDRVDG